MQDGRKAVWSIHYVSVAFFPSLKQEFIAYRCSKVSSRPDCIFEIHQLWQLGFNRVYSNCCCSCSFEFAIIKIGQSSPKMYSNNIVNFQESTTILNTCIKKSGNLLNAPRIYQLHILAIISVRMNSYSLSITPNYIRWWGYSSVVLEFWVVSHLYHNSQIYSYLIVVVLIRPHLLVKSIFLKNIKIR